MLFLSGIRKVCESTFMSRWGRNDRVEADQRGPQFSPIKNKSEGRHPVVYKLHYNHNIWTQRKKERKDVQNKQNRKKARFLFRLAKIYKLVIVQCYKMSTIYLELGTRSIPQRLSKDFDQHYSVSKNILC